MFKTKAYLDLKAKREAGETVHSSEFKKHKKDVLRIAVEMVLEKTQDLPDAVRKDLLDFISALDNDPFDVNTLINYGVSTQEVIERLSAIFL